MNLKHGLICILLASLLIQARTATAQPIDDRDDSRRMRPQAVVFYVDAVNGHDITGTGSVAAPWKTITYALSQTTGPGTEIRLASGVYSQATGEMFPIVMKSNTWLNGENRDQVIILGDGQNAVFDFPSTTIYQPETIIESVTIRNGQTGVSATGTTSGGGSQFVISNTRIISNSAGLSLITSWSQVVHAQLVHSEVVSNTGTGIYLNAAVSASSAIDVVDSRIEHNGSDGIVAYTYGPWSTSSFAYCNIVLNHSTVAFNQGNGLLSTGFLYGRSTYSVLGSTVAYNTGSGYRYTAEEWNVEAASTFVNSVIAHNGMGGIFLSDFLHAKVSSAILNSTIADNQAYGVRFEPTGYGGLSVINSIIWGQPDNLATAPSDTVSFSDTSDPEYAGVNNNLAIDPQFSDGEHGDYHLLPTSPLINAGNSAYADLPPLDIDGDPRLLGSGVGIGADETQPYTVSLTQGVTPIGTVHYGETVTYTLTMTNLAAHSAGGILITDTLPDELMWAGPPQSSLGYANVTNRTLAWVGTLSGGQSSAITFTTTSVAGLPIGTVITNVATIDNRTGTLTTTPPLTITIGPRAVWVTSRQTVNAPYAEPGQTITYSLQISNTGNVTADNVVVTDTVDPHANFIAVEAGGIITNGQAIWSGLSIPGGASMMLTVAATLDAPLADTTSISNRVQIDDGQTLNVLPDIATIIYNSPTAAFDTPTHLGPVPLSVTFINQSQHAISYDWNYGDGLTATIAATHTHTYVAAGSYTVTLRVANPIGTDIITRTDYITAYQPALAGFDATPPTGLWPLSVTLTNTSVFADQFVWDYGDGVTSTVTSQVHTHSYQSPGVYTITLAASGPYNTDVFTRSRYIAVYDDPVASFSATPRTGVTPLLVAFNNSSLHATSYRWDFGDGSLNFGPNPQHYYLEPGIYTITLTASNPAASDTLIRPAYITVHAPPTAGFEVQPAVGLSPLTVTLTNTSQLADTYLWTYGDGTTSTTAALTHTHTYSQSGVYPIGLTSLNAYGGQAVTHTIVVYPPPVAGFTATPETGVAPLSVAFINMSQYAGDFYWDFGDGSSSNSGLPTHIYAASGVYTVGLRASNPGGGTWYTATNFITVYERPQPGFEASPVTGLDRQTVTFTNTSQFADRYLWDYGDGLTSTVTAVAHSHVYSNTGAYTVSLTAYKLDVAVTVTHPAYITIYTHPVANFQAVPVSGSVPLTVTFTNAATGADQFLWNFGDGVTSTVTAPTHVYTSPGNFTVTLVAANPFEADQLSKSELILAYQAPVAAFRATMRVGPAPLTVTFRNASQFADRVQWSYGDGFTSTLATTHTHTFTTPGVYTIELRAENTYELSQQTRIAYVFVYTPTLATGYVVDAETGDDLTGTGSPHSPWRTLSHALSVITQSDAEVYAASGIYDTALGEHFPLVMEPGVSLLGADYEATTLAGAGDNAVVHFPSTSEYTESTRLSGFKITQGSNGVLVEGTGAGGTSPLIEANWITGNQLGVYAYADNERGVYAQIRRNLITDNSQAGFYGYAWYTSAHVDAILSNNQIVSNGSGISCRAGSGFDFTSTCSLRVTGNRVADNAGHGILCSTYYDGQCNMQLTGNVVAGNQGWGYVHVHDGSMQYSYPQFVNNLFHDNASGGASFWIDFPTLLNNTIVNNHAYGVIGGVPTIVNSIIWGHSDNTNVTVDHISYSDVGDANMPALITTSRSIPNSSVKRRPTIACSRVHC